MNYHKDKNYRPQQKYPPGISGMIHKPCPRSFSTICVGNKSPSPQNKMNAPFDTSGFILPNFQVGRVVRYDEKQAQQ
jgi:hypothetical protein